MNDEIINKTPEWAKMCFTNPRKGVILFLQELSCFSGAKYAHIRIKSRYGNFYTMAESIGPYKTIGWRRRFHLLDGLDKSHLDYRFIDYSQTNDCKQLGKKYSSDPEKTAYLSSINIGFHIPLVCDSIELGYITLSWINGLANDDLKNRIKEYMKSQNIYIPLLYSACRSTITDNVFTDLWSAFSIIHSSPTEALCYDHIATACLKLWGPDSTIYIGKIYSKNDSIEIISVAGRRANEAMELQNKQVVPFGKGIFGFAINSKAPVISNRISLDKRFEYHSIMSSGECLGSAISVKLCKNQDDDPIAVISVEHELENYFDLDDVRYISGIASVGYQALTAHNEASDRVAREIDTLFTQMSHDVAEPLQAIIADADVLRYQASILPITVEKDFQMKCNEISMRAANIVEGSLQINRQVRKNLDAGLDGATTRVVDGRINLYRLLNSLVDTWEERGASQGVEIRCLFDSLRGINVQCDEFELKSALGHLIGNAIKYSFWGRRQAQNSNLKYDRYVTIIGRVGLNQAIIEFQNYGVGILKSELNKVKEKLYRGELAKKEGRAGTGRGLWSATVFFESIGGTILVKSDYKGAESENDTGPYFTTVKASIPYVIEED